MMGAVGSYLLKVTGSALVCGIVNKLMGEKGMLSSVVKLLTGVFMLLAVISPLVDIRLDSLSSLENMKLDGEHVAAAGQLDAKNAMADIISRQTVAYILDKAETLGAQLTVGVQLTDEMPPVPCGATLSGRISPYGKKVLSEFMETELNIPLEAQKWTG